MNLELFEERILLAIDGPQLLAAIPSTGTVIEQGTTLKVAPREILLRFDSEIDTSTISNNSIQFRRSVDDVFANGNDLVVTPGYVGQGEQNNEVIVRFADNLPDDMYRMTIVGTGANPLRDAGGKAFNGGTNLQRDFSLDLAPQVVAIVPQPITRSGNGTLSQALNVIEVYFNVNDPLEPSTARNRANYQLIRTGGTATNQDDVVILPKTGASGVTYNASTGLVRLTFDDGVLTTKGTYRLRIGTSEPFALAPTTPTLNYANGFSGAGTSFDTAAGLGNADNPFTAAIGTQTITFGDTIGSVRPSVDPTDPTSPTVLYPGSPLEPGERDPSIETHVNGGSNTGDIKVYNYNFKSNYGTLNGQPQTNLITTAQKERVREVMSYYAYYLGVQFVETANQGLTIATGDPRVNGATLNVGGVAQGTRAIMNSLVDWGTSEPRGSYFQTAMHEIGHLLGLGHNYESPSVQGGGVPDGVFPGDFDILYGQYLWPALGNDINMYRFSLANDGLLKIETIAERLRSLGLRSSDSLLDTVVTLYDADGEIIARNDDYFGTDSLVELELESGTYFVAITSTGNTDFDPTVEYSGAGGRTQGDYELRMTFRPTVGTADSIRDTTGNRLDGDRDGIEGGVTNFWFKVDTSHTIFVDKAAVAGAGQLGSITNPYTKISTALAAATQGTIVRIVGNGGADSNLGTLGDNLSYNIGFDSLGGALSDGANMYVPAGVTVMVDAGAIFKLRGANIDVGLFSLGVSREHGALQVLGTTAKNGAGQDIGSVYFTSYYNNSIGTDPGVNKSTLAKGNWGGLVFHDASDFESDGIFLNYVNQARLSYGGGAVSIESQLYVFNPIHMVTARPAITFNTITNSADSAMSADPDSFQESEFLGTSYHLDYKRVGPRIYGNQLSANSINGLFVRVLTPNSQQLVPLTVQARFASTDIVHVLQETLLIEGQSGGATRDAAGILGRPSARLLVDPGIVMKMRGGRFETEIGAQLVAEGTLTRPIIFTSVFDDRYGAGGTFDTTNDSGTSTASQGDWGGFMFGPTSTGSIDRALVAYGGGTITVEGEFGTMNPVEIFQANVRIVRSTFDHNALPGGGDRGGRGASDGAVIYIRGAQPVILNNIFKNNFGSPGDGVFVPNVTNSGAVISVNVNSLNSKRVDDWGRSRGRIDPAGSYPTNTGPLIRNNLIGNNTINGMIVRGGTVTTNSIWDDTDIVHVVKNTITLDNQQSLSGTMRLQSSPTASLVVKVLGTNVDFIASGSITDVEDRLGSSLQIVGTPGHQVVITSLKDDTVGAGLTPEGLPQVDTLNRKGVVAPEPADLPNQGPIMLDTTSRDVHGGALGNNGISGWLTLLRQVLWVYMNSGSTGDNDILYIGVEEDQDLGVPYSREAIDWVAGQLGLTVTYADTSNEILGANFASYKMVYVPSDSSYPLPDGRTTQYAGTEFWGGVTDFELAALEAREVDLRNYVNNQGGGLLVMAQDGAADPYGFLHREEDREEKPFVLRASGGNTMQQTTLAPADFLDMVWNGVVRSLDDDLMGFGVPFRTTFEGSTGYKRLEPWALDPITGEVVVLGLAPGGPGIGKPRDIVTPGDWGSVRLDQLSNDRNVEIINETEQGFTSTGDTNNLPSTAQSLGELAKDQLSGDDNVRLGFEIFGALSQAADGSGGADVDVYSFRGTPGTQVWIDIDRTASALDTVVELVDFNGGVLARSDNSLAESHDNSLLVGIGRPLQLGTVLNDPSPYSTLDFYTSNPKDAGMRVLLPTTGSNDVQTYYVRVRSSSANLNNLAGGETKGAYVMQIRLKEVDEFPGSTVRYADIRYAENGVEVLGKPERSPMYSDTVEIANSTLTFDNRVYDEPLELVKSVSVTDLGNLLASDRRVINAGGELTGSDTIDDLIEVDWYKFSLSVEQVQSIAGYNDDLRSFSTMFQVNYADGLGRPDTTMALFTSMPNDPDLVGELVMIARDGKIIDSLPRPDIGGIGVDSANLSHGSFGALDPTIGPLQLFAGAPGDSITFYLAVTSNEWIPEALTASLYAAGGDPLVRLEPLDSITRVVDDRIGFSGSEEITTAGSNTQIFPASTAPGLNAFADPYTLSDVVLFANQEYDAATSRLRQVNPFTGSAMTNQTLETNGIGYYDIAMRNDGKLYTLSKGTTNLNTGNYIHLNTGTGGIISSMDDGLNTSNMVSATKDDDTGLWTVSYVESGRGIQFDAMTFVQTYNSAAGRRLFAFGSRAGNDPGGPPPQPTDWVGPVTLQTNLLYELDPDTGAVLHATDDAERTVFGISDPLGTLAGTNAYTFGKANVNGTINGMVMVNNRMIVSTSSGELYEIIGWNRATPQAGNFLISATPITTNFSHAPFHALTLGPRNVEGGVYASTVFGIDTDGELYAFDLVGLQAQAKPVFLNGATSISTGLTNVEGLAFSTLDYNLWHATTQRGTDAGHGINPTFNNNVDRTTAQTNINELFGYASFYFGLDPVPGPGDPAVQQPGAGAYTSNTDMYHSYALPGGAYGSLTSKTFSLEGYDAFDLPTLYFNYFLETPDVNSETDAIDAFRVFASTDGVNWEILTTNNSVDSEAPDDTYTVSGGSYRGQSADQKVQETFDSTGFWRQARVDLGDYAGLSNIRLRFQFSTAGTMGSGNSNYGTGAVLKALAGSQLQDGDTFTIDAQTFTFRVNPINPSDVELNAAWTSEQVAREIAAAIDRVFAVNDVNNYFQVAKVVQDEVRLFGHSIVDPGPLLTPNDSTLPGDENGRFTFSSRSRDFAFYEGVYIDDIVVGFASRGELVTGSQTYGVEPAFVAFDRSPELPDTQQIVTGQYQLQIRPSSGYYADIDGDNGLNYTRTFDVNDRFANAITLVAKAGSEINDGDTFLLDGGTLLNFEFNSTGGVSSGNVAINFLSTDSAATIAEKIRDAINLAVTSLDFGVRASTEVGGDRVNLFDAIDAFNIVGTAVDVILFAGEGDIRPGGSTRADAPGQTIIQNSTVRYSRQVGIQVAPKLHQIVQQTLADIGMERYFAFSTRGEFPIGVVGRTGAAAVLPVLNNERWIPGITIKNNLVIHSERTAIQVGGSPNTPDSYSLGIGDTYEQFVPFVRVLNNTIYEAFNGIAVVNGATATILNNIVANTGLVSTRQIYALPDGGSNGAGLAVYTDGSSTAVIGTGLYQNSIIGEGGSNAVVLGPSDPLFVDAANDNYYLDKDSKAIDSSINSLQDRLEMTAVTEPLGIPQSPVQAPTRDLLGQFRIDDPLVDSPPGLGSDVFKDRGAIERADFVGPTVALANPVDNDAGGLDRNAGTGQVLLVNALLTDFAIQLLDGTGAGIDDISAADVSKFVIEQTINGQTTTLVPGVDYALAYDTNNKIARLIPAQGLWVNAVYTIRLDNSEATGIRDLAGNTLQPNVGTTETRFIIELTDTIVSPWQNPNNKYDVQPDGIISGRDLVAIVNRLLQGQAGQLPTVANVPPYIDVSGDGRLSVNDALQLINYILTTGGGPISAAPAAAPAAESSEDAESAVPAAEALATTAPEATVEMVTAEPAAATEPIAAPATANDSLAVGLTMQQTSLEVASFDTLSQESAASPVSAVALDEVVIVPALLESPELLDAPITEEDLNGTDDFDSILADLSDDLRERVWV